MGASCLAQMGGMMDQQRKKSSLGYVPALDGLRGIAILLVLGHHAYGGWDAGSVGVDIFFVLSGYLITAILLKDMDRYGRISLVDFYIRRLFRLYPALLVVILAIAALTPMVGANWRAILAAGTYTTNLGTVFLHLDLGPLKHTWSLAQEEQFYLIWPLILIAATRLRVPRKVLFAVTALVAVGCLGLFVIATGSGTATLNPVARMGGLAAGCAIALGLNAGLIKAVRAWFMWTAATVGVFTITLSSAHLMPMALLAPAVIVCALPLITGLVTGRDRIITGGLSFRPMTYVGVISYSLYLWHFPLFYFAQSMHLGPWLTAAIVLPASFALAALSRKYVELPALSLRDRLASSRRASDSVETRQGVTIGQS